MSHDSAHDDESQTLLYRPTHEAPMKNRLPLTFEEPDEDSLDGDSLDDEGDGMKAFETDLSAHRAAVLQPPVESERQLTLRGVVVGSLIGAVVCVSNIYFGFKTSLTLGSSFTGAILGFAAMAAMPGFNLKENCAVTSACNAAGGFSAGYLTAIPALMWLGKTFTLGQLLLWTASAGFLGVFYMPPLRKHMILSQNLAFPSGTATAVVIAQLHEARVEGFRRAWSLMVAMLCSGIFVMIAYFIPVLSSVPVMLGLGLPAAHSAGFYLNTSPALIGSGVFTGLKNSATMFGAAVVAYGVLGPAFVCVSSNKPFTVDAIFAGCTGGGLMGHPLSSSVGVPTFAVMQHWWLWVSIAVMFSDQVVGMCLQYKSIAAALSLHTLADRCRGWRGMRQNVTAGASQEIVDPAPLSEQVSARIWLPGFLLSSAACVTVVTLWFEMRVWEAIIAVLFGIPLAIICIQCTGETDTTPTGAVGKMSQLLFAILTPHAPIPNLMAANIASSGGTQSADIMQSFKTGNLLHASPRAQFFASIAGCVTGVWGSIAGWYMFKGLIPACPPPKCTSNSYPAPAAQVWYAAAMALSDGISALPHGVIPFTVAGLVYGAAAAVARVYLRPSLRPFVPSSVALSLGVLLGPPIPLAFLIGALLWRYWSSHSPSTYTDLGVPLASGMIAGEGLAGILQGVLGLAGVQQGALSLAGCYGYPC